MILARHVGVTQKIEQHDNFEVARVASGMYLILAVVARVAVFLAMRQVAALQVVALKDGGGVVGESRVPPPYSLCVLAVKILSA